jgi:AcrR family transcriptional regulator
VADDERSPLRREPVQARSKQRIKRILDAAEQLFVDVGYSAATTNQVAVAAKTSVGSIYEFFRNKKALARGLADRYLAELAELYPGAADDDQGGSGASISAMVDSLHAFYVDHPALGPLLRGCRDSEDLQSLAQSFHVMVAEHVERILAAHRQTVDAGRRRAVAQMCAHVLLSVLEQSTGKADRPELLAELKLLLTAYLATALPPTSG